jgi:hypothetical protein
MPTSASLYSSLRRRSTRSFINAEAAWRFRSGEALGSSDRKSRTRTSALYWPETLVLYRKRVSPEGWKGSRELCALSIQPFEGSRSGLRRARALCKFNCGKSGFGDAPGTCSRARHQTGGGEELLKTQMRRGRMVLGNGKKGLVGQEDTKRGSEPRRARIS